MNNKNDTLEAYILNMLGNENPFTVKTMPHIEPPKESIHKADEEREIMIKYVVGQEKDCKVTISNDIQRCREDSAAAIHALAKLVQHSTPIVHTSGNKLVNNISAAIINSLFNSVVDELQEACK